MLLYSLISSGTNLLPTTFSVIETAAASITECSSGNVFVPKISYKLHCKLAATLDKVKRMKKRGLLNSGLYTMQLILLRFFLCLLPSFMADADNDFIALYETVVDI
jgi:hypothetical protein